MLIKLCINANELSVKYQLSCVNISTVLKILYICMDKAINNEQ